MQLTQPHYLARAALRLPSPAPISFATPRTPSTMQSTAGTVPHRLSMRRPSTTRSAGSDRLTYPVPPPSRRRHPPSSATSTPSFTTKHNSKGTRRRRTSTTVAASSRRIPAKGDDDNDAPTTAGTTSREWDGLMRRPSKTTTRWTVRGSLSLWRAHSTSVESQPRSTGMGCKAQNIEWIGSYVRRPPFRRRTASPRHFPRVSNAFKVEPASRQQYGRLTRGSAVFDPERQGSGCASGPEVSTNRLCRGVATYLIRANIQDVSLAAYMACNARVPRGSARQCRPQARVFWCAPAVRAWAGSSQAASPSQAFADAVASRTRADDESERNARRPEEGRGEERRRKEKRREERMGWDGMRDGSRYQQAL